MNNKRLIDSIVIMLGTLMGTTLGLIVLVIIKAIELYDLIADHRWMPWISR